MARLEEELHREKSRELRRSPLSTELNTDEHMHLRKCPKAKKEQSKGLERTVPGTHRGWE